MSLAAPVDGRGEGSVVFTVAANQDPLSRNGGLTVNEQEIQISQEARPCEFSLSSNHEAVDALGGQGTIQITTSSPHCEWTAQTEDGWIEIVDGRQGRGNGTVTFRVAGLVGDTRTGTLSIAGVRVRIEQARQIPPSCSASIGPVSFTFGSSGGNGEIHVTVSAGCVWSAESLVGWIAITGRSASTGPGVVTFRVAATDGPARSGFLRIAGHMATVDQSPGCVFTVGPASHAAPVSGGASAVTVNTAGGCAWTAASGAGWIVIGGSSSGTGPGRLEFSVAPNTGPERSGALLVAGRTVSVTQPSGCRYEISPLSHDAPAGGSTSTVTIATAPTCPWNAASAASWVAPATSTGIGPAQLQLVAAPNNGPARTTTLSIAGRTFTVHQASPCTYMLNPSASSFSANGGPGLILVFVTGPCTWTAGSDVGWITLSLESGSGAGSGFVHFSVAAHNGPARAGTIVIGGIPHRVTQEAR